MELNNYIWYSFFGSIYCGQNNNFTVLQMCSTIQISCDRQAFNAAVCDHILFRREGAGEIWLEKSYTRRRARSA